MIQLRAVADSAAGAGCTIPILIAAGLFSSAAVLVVPGEATVLEGMNLSAEHVKMELSASDSAVVPIGCDQSIVSR